MIRYIFLVLAIVFIFIITQQEEEFVSKAVVSKTVEKQIDIEHITSEKTVFDKSTNQTMEDGDVNTTCVTNVTVGSPNKASEIVPDVNHAIEALAEDINRNTNAINNIPSARDGIDGSKGEKGDRGERGSTGPEGRQGSEGMQGLKGEDGKDGAPGSDGKDGSDGRDGVSGKEGRNGYRGDKGENGLDGERGIDGRDSRDGRDFKFSDFTQSQLESLRGKQGVQGIQGSQGMQGVPGPTGKAFTYTDFTPEQLKDLRTRDDNRFLGHFVFGICDASKGLYPMTGGSYDDEELASYIKNNPIEGITSMGDVVILPNYAGRGVMTPGGLGVGNLIGSIGVDKTARNGLNISTYMSPSDSYHSVDGYISVGTKYYGTNIPTSGFTGDDETIINHVVLQLCIIGSKK